MSADEMVTVTKDEFYAVIMAEKTLNIHPCTNDPDVTTWEIVNTRQVIGRSWPGWCKSGLPESIQPRRYELRKSIVDRANRRKEV